MNRPATVVFGEAVVDDFRREPVVGGAPFNVARHLAAFMEPQLMITRVGCDRHGGAVLAEFERFAMRQDGLQRDPIEETGRLLVERGPDGHRYAIPPHQAYDYIDREQALAALATVAPRAFYFGTLAQRGEVSRAALDGLLAASAAPRFLDLNLDAGQAGREPVTRALQAAQVIKANEAELQSLLHWFFGIDPAAPPPPAAEVQAACRALLEMFSLAGLIVTLGHRGSVYFGAGGATIVNRDNPAPPFVIDTAGAGDGFAAIFLLGQARGWALETTLARANAFAGALCALSGAVPRELGFYEQWEARWRAA